MFSRLVVSIKASLYDKLCAILLHKLSHLNLHIYPGGKSYDSHFMNEESEIWRGCITRPRSYSSNMKRIITKPMHSTAMSYYVLNFFFWTHSCLYVCVCVCGCMFLKCEFHATFLERICYYLSKIVNVPFDPEIVFLWIDPKDMNKCPHVGGWWRNLRNTSKFWCLWFRTKKQFSKSDFFCGRKLPMSIKCFAFRRKHSKPFLSVNHREQERGWKVADTPTIYFS